MTGNTASPAGVAETEKREGVTLQYGCNTIEKLMTAALVWRDRLLREAEEAKAKGNEAEAAKCLSIARAKSREAQIAERVCGLIDLAMSDRVIMDRLLIAAEEKQKREAADRLAAEGDLEKEETA